MRISDWSADVCSSDLGLARHADIEQHQIDVVRLDRPAQLLATACGSDPEGVQFQVLLDRLADARLVVDDDNVLLTLHVHGSSPHSPTFRAPGARHPAAGSRSGPARPERAPPPG